MFDTALLGTNLPQNHDKVNGEFLPETLDPLLQDFNVPLVPCRLELGNKLANASVTAVDANPFQLFQQLPNSIGARRGQGRQGSQCWGRAGIRDSTESFKQASEIVRDLAKVLEVGSASAAGTMAKNLKGPKGKLSARFQELQDVSGQGDGCEGFGHGVEEKRARRRLGA